jgi:hypothetical protein
MPSGRSPPPGSPNRLRSVGPVPQLYTQASQPLLQTCRFDSGEGRAVNAWCAAVGFRQRPRMGENIRTPNLVVQQIEAVLWLRLRLAIKLSLERPDLCGCLQAHRQSPCPRFLGKHTRSKGPSLHRHYPASSVLWPSPTSVRSATLAATLGSPPRPRRISPDYPHRHSNVPCPLPRWTEMGAHVGCFPIRLGLPRTAVGSASTSSLSRPARASRVLRPAGPLNRPTATFVTRLRPGRLPDRAARQLPDQPTILWVEPTSTGVTRLRGAPLLKKGFDEGL